MNHTNKDCFIEYLPFDTEVLGVKCGKLFVKNGFLAGKILDMVLEEAKKNKFEHLVAKIPSESVVICNLLEGRNFRFKLSSLELEKRLLKRSTDIGIDDIFLFNEKDTNRLIEITKSAFYTATRFHYEPKFTIDKIAELHKRWIYNLINSKKVKIYVHRAGGAVTGYITVELQNEVSGKAHIGLFAVDKEHRGKGIGAKLLHFLDINLFGSIDILSVTTESINYAALKTYFHCGFSIKKSWSILYLSL